MKLISIVCGGLFVSTKAIESVKETPILSEILTQIVRKITDVESGINDRAKSFMQSADNVVNIVIAEVGNVKVSDPPQESKENSPGISSNQKGPSSNQAASSTKVSRPTEVPLFDFLASERKAPAGGEDVEQELRNVKAHLAQNLADQTYLLNFVSDPNFKPTKQKIKELHGVLEGVIRRLDAEDGAEA